MRKLLFILPIVLISCVSKDYKSQPNSLTVMTYNVENLFDTLDDEGKDDETYLPKNQKTSRAHKLKCAGLSKEHYRKECLSKDWNSRLVERKMNRLAHVIKQVRSGQGPDVLIVQEVENLNVLTRFKMNHLNELGYKEIVHIEGPDQRGIDVAMISKLSLLKKPKLHEIDLKPAAKEAGKNPIKVRPTRGILEAQFQLPDGESLTVFGVHFPSQGSPTPYRKVALETLNKARKALAKDELVIAAGDFNITTKEDGEHQLFGNEDMKNLWLVSHYIGCHKCEGTHNYRGDWSFLDVMLFSHNFKYSSWSLDPQSIRIPNKSIYQKNDFGNPARFSDGRSQLGVSDHWPLAVDIQPKEVR